MQFAGRYMGNEGPGRDEKESKMEKMREKKAGPNAEKKEMKTKPPAKKAVAPKRKAK